MLSPGVDPLIGSPGSTVPVLADRPIRAVQRRTVWALAAAQVAGGLGIGAAISVGSLLALDISGSEIWAGVGTTAITLGAALAALPLAALAARSGRRRSLSLAWGLAALGAAVVIASAILGSFLLLFAGLLLTGVGNAASYQSRYAATDLALPNKRGRDLSLVVWSTTAGSVLGPNLSEPGRVVAQTLHIPVLVGPFVFSALGMGVAVVLILTLLRPDPLLLARRLQAAVPADVDTSGPDGVEADGVGAADPDRQVSVWATVWHNPRARLGMSAIVASQGVMVAVMTMTPVHLRHHGATLTIIGLTISLHIAGMFAFSPVFGWLADKRGRVTTILIGQGLLACAAVAAGTSGASEPRLMVGLFLLGLGWSAGLVAGSTLLAESVPLHARLRVQGTSDVVMNLVGAAGGALSGVILGLIDFSGLNAVAGVLVVPTVVFAVAAVQSPKRGIPPVAKAR